MLNQYADPNNRAAMTATIGMLGITAKFAYDSISNFAFQALNYGPVGYVTDTVFGKSAPEVAKSLPNPFEYIDKCPAATDMCPLFSNLTNDSSFLSSIMNSYGVKVIGEYAQPYISVASSGLVYLPVIAQGPQAVRMMNDLRNGNYQAAAKKALGLSSSALISIAVANVGMVALPVGLVAKHGLEKAFDKVYGQNEINLLDQPNDQNEVNPLILGDIFDNFTPETSALALGVMVEPTDSGDFQIIVNGDKVGMPVSDQTLKGLAAYASSQAMTQFDEVKFDYDNQTVEFENSGIPIPFSEIEALYQLNFEDLPSLVQLGILDLFVSDEGEVTISLNEKELPEGYQLTIGTKKFLSLLDRQSDKSISVSSENSLLNIVPRTKNEIVSLQESGLVPVNTSNGQALISVSEVGPVLAKALDIENTLRNPNPDDGSLSLRINVVSAPQQNGTPITTSFNNEKTTIKVPVKEVQQVAHQLVDEKVKSLYEQQKDLAQKWGF